MNQNFTEEKCPICEVIFQAGDGRYGVPINRYELYAYTKCVEINHDGLAPRREKNFERHLKEKGIPLPERNAKGLYPFHR